ncbi:MAG: ABC transporter permease [Anaerolineales bacterium]|jgi:peptide/nickel transport system permease protein
MSSEAHALQVSGETPEQNPIVGTLTRVAKYTGVRFVILILTVVVGVYLTILIANMGGYVDSIIRGQIRENIALVVQHDPNFRTMDPSVRAAWIAEQVELEESRLGLDQPFVIRSFRFLFKAMVLDLGRAQLMTSDEGSREVRLIIQERLGPTLLIMGVANFILFFGSVFAALALSRKYGSFLDRLVIALSPSSSAPSWFYGIFLILIFAALLRILPFNGMVDSPPPETKLGYTLSVLKHAILPVSAIVIANIFLGIYNWRTFFLVYSSEDYVDMAKAKGLSDRAIERRYILRPTLPTIITNFSLTLIALWTGSIILETVFIWPGLGRTYYTAIGLYDTAVIVGLTIIYAYMLVLTVFLLDFVYALVDPRVKIGAGSN